MHKVELDLDASYWYLMSPYSKYHKGHDAAFHHVVANQALLLRAGIMTFSPIGASHMLAKAHGMGSDYETFRELDECMMLVARGGIILRMDGWQESTGVTEETSFLTALKRPIVYMEPGIVPRVLLKIEQGGME